MTAPGRAHLAVARQLLARGLSAAAFDLAVQIAAGDPAEAEALALMGGIARRADWLERSLALGRRAPETLNDLANLRGGAGAEPLLREALAIDPASVPALTNLGLAWQNRGRSAEAIGPLSQAVALAPGAATLWSNLAAATMSAGFPTRGARHAARALILNPDLAAAHYNLGMCRLMEGDLVAGFAGHEWRFAAGAVPAPAPSGPRWTGAPAPGARLYLHAEQGLGDSLLFARYAALAAARVGRVILGVQPQLVRLFQDLEGVDAVVPLTGPPPAHDLQCPLMSVPHALASGGDAGAAIAIPPPPRLAPDKAAAARFKARLDALPGLKIGLVWQGNPAFAGDPTRSIPLEALAPLGAVPGVTWISLQMGADRARPGIGPPLIDWMGEIGDLTETAGLILGLDLVIAVDTMLGHLTGALGRPVWIMNRFNTCWRWFLDRRDCPFYPSVRLYRQAAPGSWEATIAAVAADLANLATSKRGGR